MALSDKESLRFKVEDISVLDAGDRAPEGYKEIVITARSHLVKFNEKQWGIVMSVMTDREGIKIWMGE